MCVLAVAIILHDVKRVSRTNQNQNQNQNSLLVKRQTDNTTLTKAMTGKLSFLSVDILLESETNPLLLLQTQLQKKTNT